MKGRLGIASALTALLLLAVGGRAGAAEALVLQLGGPAQFEFAGYYAALWQGFYRDAGLDVTIRPGGAAPVDPVREVTEGRAQFGTGGVQLLVRAAQGLPILLLAPVFQDSGARVYSRADSAIASPGGLAGVRVGRLPASSILDIELRSALKREGVDPDKLHSVAIRPDQVVPALAGHDIDAAIGSMWHLPWQAQVSRLAIKSFNPADYRTEFYGDGLFTLQRIAEADPDMVRRFRAASLQGWAYALQHPDEVARRLPAPPGIADAAGFARYQSDVARTLSRYPAVPLGHSNPGRWSDIQNELIAAGAMARPADLGAFLYDPDGKPHGDGGRRDLAAIAAAVGVLLLAGLAWGWRRRAAPVRAAAIARRGGDGERSLAAVVAEIAAELREAVERVAAAIEQIRRQVVLQPRLGPASASALDALGHLRIVEQRLSTAAARTAGGPRPTDLNAFVSQLEASIRGRLPANVTLRLSLLPDLEPGELDTGAVAPALEALVTAALADMPAGGTLIIGTRRFAIDAATAAANPGAAVGDYVRITVRDDGGGLPPERLAQIFDPAATARPAVAAAHAVVARIGGFARVESAEGVGTAVHLYFRRSAEAGAAAFADDKPARAAAE